MQFIREEMKNGAGLEEALQNSFLKYPRVKMAVVVQRMVRGAAAGVGFNVEKGTGRRGAFVEANYGMGEAVVSGQVSPDSWAFDEQGKELKDRHPGERKRKIVLENGGNTWKEISPEDRGMYCLNDEQAHAIARQVVRIGDVYRKKPGHEYIDIEFVIDGQGKLYFVQARPETVHSQEKDRAGRAGPVMPE
jgi:pyruvate,water dikinase